jgi:four helix bundle protein
MSYKNLLVWKESYRLTILVYKLTDSFPSTERYGITSQMRRAAVSIASNLAEGSRRQGSKEMKNFCAISFGSASELEVQLALAKDLNFAPKEHFSETEQALQSTLRLLNLINHRAAELTRYYR